MWKREGRRDTRRRFDESQSIEINNLVSSIKRIPTNDFSIISEIKVYQDFYLSATAISPNIISP